MTVYLCSAGFVNLGYAQLTAVKHGVDISSLLEYVYIALSIAQFEFTRNVAQGYRTRILCNINIAVNGLADTGSAAVDCINARVDGDIAFQIAAEFNRFCLVYCCIARAGNNRIIYYFGCAGIVGNIEVSAVENNVNFVYRVGNFDVALGVGHGNFTRAAECRIFKNGIHIQLGTLVECRNVDVAFHCADIGRRGNLFKNEIAGNLFAFGVNLVDFFVYEYVAVQVAVELD